MTGKELAGTLFEALDKGTPGDDPGLVEEMIGAIAGLSTEEMWRFVLEATTVNRGRNDPKPFLAFNAAVVKQQRFSDALKAMMAAPRPPELPQVP